MSEFSKNFSFIKKKYFLSIFVILIFTAKIHYNFFNLNLNYVKLNFFNFPFVILKEVLLSLFIIFLVINFLKNKNEDILYFFKYLIVIVIFIFLKFSYYNFIDFSYIIIIKNFLLPFSLIYLSYFLKYDEFISLLKIIILILGCFLLYQITFLYPDFDEYLDHHSKVEILSKYIPGFISGRAIGIFDSPNSLGKFCSLSLIIILSNIYFTRQELFKKKKVKIFKLLTKNFFLNCLIILILLFGLLYSMTISAILALACIFFIYIFYFLFLSSNKNTFYIFILFLIALALFTFFNPEMVKIVTGRFEDLKQFVQFLNSLEYKKIIKMETEDYTSIKSSFGTFAARLIDLVHLLRCYEYDATGLILFGCKSSFDHANIGYVNLISNYGIIINLIIFYIILKVLFQFYTKENLYSKLITNIETRKIYFTFINILAFALLISIPSKVLGISVVNYLIYIMIGYYLKFFKESDKKIPSY